MYSRTLYRHKMMVIFLVLVFKITFAFAVEPGGYDSRDWNEGQFDPGGGWGSTEGVRVVHYRVDTGIKPGRKMLKKKAAWEYIGIRDGDTSWLWVNKAGRKQDVSGVQQWLRKLGKKIGIRLYPHLLRHTFAISFLRNGGNVFALQSTLGHSSLEMTRRYCQALGFEDVFREHELASPIDNVIKRYKRLVPERGIK